MSFIYAPTLYNTFILEYLKLNALREKYIPAYEYRYPSMFKFMLSERQTTGKKIAAFYLCLKYCNQLIFLHSSLQHIQSCTHVICCAYCLFCTKIDRLSIAFKINVIIVTKPIIMCNTPALCYTAYFGNVFTLACTLYTGMYKNHHILVYDNKAYSITNRWFK